MPYLSPQDVGDGLSLEFIALSELKSKPKKAGGTYEVYELIVKHNDGRTATYDVFPKTVEICGLDQAKTGDQIMAYDNKGFVNFKPLPKGEAVLSVDQPSNYAQNKRDKALSEQDDHQKIREVMISLAGLTQAYIIAGNETPLQSAIEMRKKIIDAAISEVRDA